MSEPIRTSSDHLRSVPPNAQAALAHAAGLYRVARRLTRRPEEAAAATAAAVVACASAERAPLSRSRAYGALWKALEQQWAGQPLTRKAPRRSPEDVLDAVTLDEAELERMMLSRLDASPDVDMALRQLPERERFVVLLVDVEDCSYEETAEALGADVAAVGPWLLAARVRLFASMAEFARRTGSSPVLRS